MPEQRPWARPLSEVLEIEPAGDDAFEAVLSGFGGVTLGCAALAAARTRPDRPLHALHAWFLRPVPPETRVLLRVERVRDGRRFAHRRVRVEEGARLLCEILASFAAPGEGASYQEAEVEASTPGPESLPGEEEVARADGMSVDEPGPFGGPLEWRWIGVPWRDPAPGTPSRYRAWVRPRFALPPERAFRAGALAFLTDYHSHMPVARRLGRSFDPREGTITSLDQAIWVHRDLPWDDWWLLVSESDVSQDGCALSRRLLHARDGRLVATMAQEQLLS